MSRKGQLFDPKLPALIAAGLGRPVDLAAECGMNQEEWEAVRHTPAFKTALHVAERELEEHGFTPEVSELQALQAAFHGMLRKMVKDFHMYDTPISERVKLFEKLDRMIQSRRSRLDPKGADLNQGPKFELTINIPGAGDMKVVGAATQHRPDIPGQTLPLGAGINADLMVDEDE